MYQGCSSRKHKNTSPLHKCTYMQIYLWPRRRQVASFVQRHPRLTFTNSKALPYSVVTEPSRTAHRFVFRGFSQCKHTKLSHEIQHFLNIKLFTFLLRTANAINEAKKRCSLARPYRQPARRGWVWGCCCGREPKSICSACHSSGQGHVKVKDVFVFTFSDLLWRESI